MIALAEMSSPPPPARGSPRNSCGFHVQPWGMSPETRVRPPHQLTEHPSASVGQQPLAVRTHCPLLRNQTGHRNRPRPREQAVIAV